MQRPTEAARTPRSTRLAPPTALAARSSRVGALREEVRHLKRRCPESRHVDKLLAGLARLRELWPSKRCSEYLQLEALKWLFIRFADGQTFPTRCLAGARSALRYLFDEPCFADDTTAVISTRAYDAPPRVRMESTEAFLSGRIVGRNLERVRGLFRAVVQFPDDARPVCVLSSSLYTDDDVPTGRNKQTSSSRLSVAEGELLTIGGLICLLQYAYPNRPIQPLVAAKPDRQWCHCADDADSICIGAHNSNAATRLFLDYMDIDERPRPWIETSSDSEPYIPLTAGGRIVYEQKDGDPSFARDGGVVHLRGQHHLGKGGRVCFMAGIETYGTAMAVASLADEDFLCHLASRYSGPGPSTHVLIGETSGLAGIWPVRYRAVWPRPWPSVSPAARASVVSPSSVVPQSST